jgi:hypothetical protein
MPCSATRKTKKEEWLELCQHAIDEQDPQKLVALVAEIDRLSQAKEQRSKAQKQRLDCFPFLIA